MFFTPETNLVAAVLIPAGPQPRPLRCAGRHVRHTDFISHDQRLRGAGWKVLLKRRHDGKRTQLRVLVKFAGLIFHALALASASVAFGIGAVTMSGAWSLVRRGAREFPREPGWLTAPVAGWALSGPLGGPLGGAPAGRRFDHRRASIRALRTRHG